MIGLVQKATGAMNVFEKFLHALSGTMTTPKLYGIFHIACFVLVLLGTVLIGRYFSKASDKSFRIIVGVLWTVIFLLEVYKQLIYTFEWNGSVATWDYQWYAFPFQLCSMQLYVLPLVFLCKDGHVRDGAMAFLATYSFFAGAAVFVYPGDVYVETIGINIQTMVHHGLQIVLGVLFLMRNKNKLGIKFFLKGVATFLVLICVAQILNAIVPTFTDETFNMFYISWKFNCTLPVLSAIYPNVPYIVFLFLYVVGFSIAASIVLLVARGIKSIYGKIKATKAFKHNE